MDEEWRRLEEYPSYEVSNKGRVRSIDRIAIRKGRKARIKGMLLNPKSERGYLSVTLYSGSRREHKKTGVHRLVAMAFIPNPNNYPYVNHKDENKENNNSDNLEWCTAKYNSNYGTAIERRVAHQDWQSIAEKNSRSVIAVDDSGRIVKRYKSMTSASNDGHKTAGITKCCKGQLKTYHGLTWRYA